MHIHYTQMQNCKISGFQYGVNEFALFWDFMQDTSNYHSALRKIPEQRRSQLQECLFCNAQKCCTDSIRGRAASVQ
jgi:hypothetical protein